MDHGQQAGQVPLTGPRKEQPAQEEMAVTGRDQMLLPSVGFRVNREPGPSNQEDSTGVIE